MSMDQVTAGFLQGRSSANYDAAVSWQNYARELEQKLAVEKARFSAMETLKNAAIQELGKVDPKNFLMTQANRQRIIDEAFAGK